MVECCFAGLSNGRSEGRTVSNTSDRIHFSQSNMVSGRAGSSHRQHEAAGASLNKWPGIEVLLEAYQRHIQGLLKLKCLIILSHFISVEQIGSV